MATLDNSGYDFCFIRVDWCGEMAVADCHSVGFSLVPFRADVQIEHSSPKQYWRMSSQISRQEVNT